MIKCLITFLPMAAMALQAQAPLSVQDAIRTAWNHQAGLQAGEAMVAKARAEASAMGALRLPSATLGVGFIRTDEPMMAFGTRLDQARIAQVDFQPSSLNHPDPIQGTGATLTLTQPLYAGGRLDAARRAGADLADAEGAAQGHRRQQVALAITQAYFGAQVADEALRNAEDTLKQADETDRFVQARVAQGLMLKADGERTRAFCAQSGAGVAEAQARVASARSALAMLAGADVAADTLITPLAIPMEEPAHPDGQRGDLLAMREQARAAEEGVIAAGGSLKPEVGLQLTAGTLRDSLNSGGNWTAVSLGARWTFSFGDSHRVSAARAAARAAELTVKWQESVASREVEEARRAIRTAEARIGFARTAVAASEAVRTLRAARYREGLLPLMDVLDSESSLTGARTLLLSSQLDFRLGQAQLSLALGQPIENVKE